MKKVVIGLIALVLGLGFLQANKALYDAVVVEDVNEVEALLKDRTIDVHYKTLFELTPLHEAAAHGNLKIVRMLLDAGASAADTNKSGETPVHIAAKKGFSETVKMLIPKEPFTMDQEDKFGESPIYKAVSMGHAGTVKVLIAARSGVNKKEKLFGYTPLHKAVLQKNHKIVKILLDADADRSLKDNAGKTAEDYADTPEIQHLLQEHTNNKKEEAVHSHQKQGDTANAIQYREDITALEN